ncbi:MAG: cupin domain-containing protein [Anaerolineae bacterium]|nr:cupin domain-containing protein [Anaerolineae bacterium]
MKIKHWTDVPAQDVPDAPGVTIRWILNERDGAPHFAMRILEVQPGSATPQHSHWWEHEVFVLAGQGVFATEAGESPLVPGSTVLVDGNELHQFRNTGGDVLRFMCLIPHRWLEELHDKYAGI